MWISICVCDIDEQIDYREDLFLAVAALGTTW